jgi:hypothetical protein
MKDIYSKKYMDSIEHYGSKERSKIDMDLSNHIVYDLKSLIKISIKKIQHLENDKSIVYPLLKDVSSEVHQIISQSELQNISNSENNQKDIESQDIIKNNQSQIVDVSESIVIQNVSVESEKKDERFKSFDDFTLKIFEEMSSVNHILNKVQTFKSNMSLVNKTLESLRRFKTITGIPEVIQSEKPRERIAKNISRVQATPRRQVEILTLEECKTWMKNKTINPQTGRKIDVNGPTYKRIEMTAKMYRLF